MDRVSMAREAMMVNLSSICLTFGSTIVAPWPFTHTALGRLFDSHFGACRMSQGSICWPDRMEFCTWVGRETRFESDGVGPATRSFRRATAIPAARKRTVESTLLSQLD